MQLVATLVAALAMQSAGLKSIDMVIGSGDAVAAGDVATVVYKGTLTNGKTFFDPAGRPPISFRVGTGSVLRGLDLGVVGMMQGGRRILSLPPELGMGERATVEIPAGSTLILDVQLLRVDRRGAKAEIETEEIKEGEGRAAQRGDTVEVHYVGSYLNGQKFDSSRDRGQTFSVTIGTTRVIRGFELGVTGMKVGGKRRVTIPYPLAYGEQGVAGAIPPFTPLVFELEMISLTPRK
jgi:FKBP-type peptidyl-prolyl cis-trans isomerase